MLNLLSEIHANSYSIRYVRSLAVDFRFVNFDRNRLLHDLNISLYKKFFNYKRKFNFTVEKPNRYHLNQVSKVNATSNGTNQYHVPPDRVQ